MSYAAGAAGGLSLFNMWATSKAIEKNNQAAVDNYNLVNASLISAQIANWNNGVYAAQEMKRVSNIGIMEAKPEIQQQARRGRPNFAQGPKISGYRHAQPRLVIWM